MILLVVQLLSIVLYALPYAEQSYVTSTCLAYVLSASQMLDVIIKSVYFQIFCFAEKSYLARA